LQPGQNFRNSCVGARQILASKQGPIGNDGIMPSCAPVQKRQNKKEVPLAPLEPPQASQPAVKLSMALQYTKPDWPVHLTAYFISDSVRNLSR